ncbi:hypothetical protein ABQF26_07995 [Mycolicibacterium elephantis]
MQQKITAAIAAGVLLFAGCGSSADTVPASSSSSTTSTSEVTTDEAIATWGDEVLSLSLDRIGDAFLWVGGAMKNLDMTDARAGCREMGHAVDELEDGMPAPDSKLTAAMEAAITNLRRYSRQCQGLSPRSTKAEFDLMMANQDLALQGLERATEIVKKAKAATR